MTAVRLISGPPASGKTSAVLDALAKRYGEDPFAYTLLLVPTARHADQLRRGLVERCGAAFNFHVQTIPQFVRRCAFPAGRSLVERDVAAVLLERVARDAPGHFAPIVHTRGFAQLLQAAVEDLEANLVEPGRLVAAARSTHRHDLLSLASIYTAYQQELEQRGWVAPAAAPAHADPFPEGPAPALVAVDGFQVLRPAEVELVAAVAARCDDIVVTLDEISGGRADETRDTLAARLDIGEHVRLGPRAVPGRGRAVATLDREAEMRAIARDVKRRLTANRALRPSDFAVVFRQAAPRLALARQVFAEFDLPLDPAAAEPLRDRPLGEWLLRLLRLPLDGWRLRDVLVVLRSEFAARDLYGLEPGHIAAVAREARRSRLWSGLDAIRRISTALRGPRDGEDGPPAWRVAAADAFEAALGDLQARLVLPDDLAAGDYAARLDGHLFGGHALVAPAGRGFEGVAEDIEALRRILLRFVTVDEALGPEPTTYAAFVARLERVMEARSVLLREPGGVLLAPMHTVHGLRFHHVEVGGLSEGEFPVPRHQPELLDEPARQLLRDAGLDIPSPARASEAQLWEAAATRATDSWTAWRPRVDERGRQLAPSYYFDTAGVPAADEPALPNAPDETASPVELAIACVAGWPKGSNLRPAGFDAWPVVREAVRVEQQRRSFEPAGAHEGRVAAGLAPALVDGSTRWSASRFEAYQTCPFQFFGRYAMSLDELDEEMEVADPVTRGQVIHDIIEAATSDLVRLGRPLGQSALPDVYARLHEHGRLIWEEAPARYGFGRAGLWRLERDDMFRRLEDLLAEEARISDELGVERVHGAEESLEGDLVLPDGMTLPATARIDRVDSGPGFAVIVDYKSGASISRNTVESDERLQLQLYAWLARDQLRLPRVIARYAFLRSKHKPWQLDTDRPHDRALIDALPRIAAEVRDHVAAGEFQVAPRVKTCPVYCAFRHACRVNQFSRHKRWS